MAIFASFLYTRNTFIFMCSKQNSLFLKKVLLNYLYTETGRNWEDKSNSLCSLKLRKWNQKSKINSSKSHSNKAAKNIRGQVSWCTIQWFVFCATSYLRKDRYIAWLRESWLSEIWFFSFLICFALAMSPEVIIL